jgi:hypothetical protein
MKDKNLLCTTELVSILTSIALKNPEIYQTFASILSTIICNLNENKKQKIIELIEVFVSYRYGIKMSNNSIPITVFSYY